MKLNDVRLKSRNLCQRGRLRKEKLLAIVTNSNSWYLRAENTSKA